MFYPKVKKIAIPLSLILKISIYNKTQKSKIGIGINDNNKIDNSAIFSILKTNSSTGSLISITQVIVKYNKVDNSRWY